MAEDNNNGSSCLGGIDLHTPFLRSETNIPGVISIIVFYGIVLVAGIIGSYVVMRKKKKQEALGTTASKGQQMRKVEDLALAGRDMGMVVGMFTLSATLVGGAIVNGTAEIMMNPTQGFVWAQAPVYFIIGLPLGSFMFGVKMHRQRCRTMVDPIHNAFGRIQAAFLIIPPVLGDVFWTASILTALGASFSVIVGLNYVWGVVISEAVSVVYTFAGGLYSVAYTDIIELFCLFFALIVALPFAMRHEAVTSITETAFTSPSWLGEVPEGVSILLYIDLALALCLGGICCWQCLYQRILAQKTIKGVFVVSTIAPFITAIIITPVVLVGAVAFSTDWNATGYRDFGEIPVRECDYPLALPMVMRFLTPTPVAVIGLGAVSAAVMSSTDSAALSVATLITINFYSPLKEAASKKKPTERELLWVMRVSVIIVGITATIIAIFVTKTYGLLVLCVDFLYLSFPQLIASLYIPTSNVYGSIVTFWLCVILRLLSGEPLIDLPAIIKFPFYDEATDTQYFPFRTFIVLLGLITLVMVSLLTRFLAAHSSHFRRLDEKTFECFVKKKVPEYIVDTVDNNGIYNIGQVTRF